MEQWPKAEVLDALTRPLAPRRDTLTPVDGWLNETEETLTLLVEVRREGQEDEQPERWRVTLPAGEEWTQMLAHLPTLRVVYRALVEEWWDTREHESISAAM